MSRPARHPGVVAVLGGTFDPPHCGHVRAAEAVRDAVGVDEVWLVVAAIPPHRAEGAVASAADRLSLVEAAVRGRDRLRASGVELERSGPSFTIDTLDRLAEERSGLAGGESPVLFVAGADAFALIRTWSRWERLLERHPVLVHRRSGTSFEEAFAALPESPRPRVSYDVSIPLKPPLVLALDVALPDPESRAIRARLAAGGSIAGLTPEAVVAEIRARGLYE